MRYLTFLTLLSFVSLDAKAQWNGTGTTGPINRAGNVGIGSTQTSINTLTVGGTLGIHGPGLTGDNLQRGVIYADLSTGFYFDAPLNASGVKLDIQFNWRGGFTSPLFIQGATSYMGVNTSVPQARLDLNGTGIQTLNTGSKIIDADKQDMIAVQSMTKASVLNLVSSRTTAGVLGGILFTTTNGWSDSHRNIAGIVGGSVGTDATAGGYLALWTKNGAGDIPRENMRLTHEGKVGIGTSLPYAKLHVLGTGASLNTESTNPISGDFVIQANTGGRNVSTGAQIEFVIPANTDGTNMYGQGRIITVSGNTGNANATGKMILGTRRYFNKYGSGVQWYYGDDLTIDGFGNIGIGTMNPTQKLEVKGSIYSSEVKVDINAGTGPDYVFEKEYTLPSLEAVKTYIDQNKHLPEVPSAKEMEANGINLSEMNMLLLKKVEELTLYVIELKKENELEKNTNHKLRSDMDQIVNEIHSIKKHLK